MFSLYEASRVGCRAAAAREPPLRATAASTEERRDEPLEARRLWSSALNDAHIIFKISRHGRHVSLRGPRLPRPTR